MSNKYTIIDNFDKLDVSWIQLAYKFNPSNQLPGKAVPALYDDAKYVDGKEEPLWVGIHHSAADKEGLDKIQVRHIAETINPPIIYTTGGSGIGPDPNAITAYPNKPISFNKDYNYVPDMFRYFVGHRFYVNSSTYKLSYPTDEEFGDMANWKELGIDIKTMGGPFSWYVDIPNIESRFNFNSQQYGNTLKLKDYYEPEGFWSLASELNTGYTFKGAITGANRILKAFGFQFDREAAGISLPHSTSDPYFRNYLVFRQALAGASVSDAMIYEALYSDPPLVHADGTTILQNEDVFKDAFFDILKKFFFFRVFRLTGGGDFGALESKQPWHLYFVTDLPKGTGQLPKEIDNTYTGIPYDVVLIKSKYNYYAEYAEGFEENFTERQLPNLYTYYLLRAGGGAYPAYYKDLVEADASFDASKFSVKQYYNLASTSPVTHKTLRYKNVVVLDRNFLNDGNTMADLFPMYNKISVPSQESDFMNLLKPKETVLNVFMSLLSNYFSSLARPESASHEFVLHNGASKVTNAVLQIMDLSAFFSAGGTAMESYVNYSHDGENVKFGGIPIYPGDEGTYYVSLLTSIKTAAQEYFLQKMLSVGDVWKGEKCHSEVLAFEIAKFKVSKGKKVHVQSIFLPSLHSGEDISYIDTQVFYGQEYTYEIFAHSLVIGTQYQIDRWGGSIVVQILGLGSGTNRIHIGTEKEEHQQPKAIIVRAPYYNTDSLIADNQALDETETKEITVLMDKPPLAPDIVFHPYKDYNNKILILLNSNHGERLMLPFPVLEGDVERINKYIQSQKNENIDKPGYIMYKTDDPVGNFLVYRTTKKPTDWSSFHNANVTNIDAAENTGYNDFISPNTDYYYFAIAQDLHGNSSYPTEIFYIRIVKESGFPPYLVTRVVNFDVPKPVYETSFKKYLKISLPPSARTAGNGALQDVSEATLGYTHPYAGAQLKKYKVRIKSKKTGKKIDINLDFATNTDTYWLHKPSDNADGYSPPLENLAGPNNQIVVPLEEQMATGKKKLGAGFKQKGGLKGMKKE